MVKCFRDDPRSNVRVYAAVKKIVFDFPPFSLLAIRAGVSIFRRVSKATNRSIMLLLNRH